MPHENGRKGKAGVAVYLFQTHGARPEFSNDSPEFVEERFQPCWQIVDLAAWQSDDASFDQLDSIGLALDHAVAGQVQARVNSDDARRRSRSRRHHYRV